MSSNWKIMTTLINGRYESRNLLHNTYRKFKLELQYSCKLLTEWHLTFTSKEIFQIFNFLNKFSSDRIKLIYFVNFLFLARFRDLRVKKSCRSLQSVLLFLLPTLMPLNWLPGNNKIVFLRCYNFLPFNVYYLLRFEIILTFYLRTGNFRISVF